MSGECGKALNEAYDVGRWTQALTEAERCVSIFATEAAQLRPAAAWAVLPLGLPVEISTELIASVPPEDDAIPQWGEHMARLQERLNRVKLQRELWKSTDEKRH